MALRYAIPDFGAVGPKVELKRPALMRQPTVVEFRRGRDMKQLASELLDRQSVVLDAAVGSGKSTAFPAALADATKSLVIHVTPNPLLAYDLYCYVVKSREQAGTLGPPLELLDDVGQELPRTGVLYSGSAGLVAWLLAHGSFPAGREVSVVLDEAHESDAYTHTLRTLVVNLGASRLIQMSATMVPSGSRSRETPGSVVVHKYPASESISDWRVDDATKPWYYAAIQNNLLVYVDSRSHAKRLTAAYSAYGLLVFRLEANMSRELFHQAMSALRDKKGPLVVLLVDYAFRSGFSFDVDRIIDTGSVSYYSCTPGDIRRLNRRFYLGEMEQGSGRGADRLRKGVTVHYYMPDCQCEPLICDLEATEREAAAYVFKCLGYEPAMVLADTVMAGADLPVAVSTAAALNGVYPLIHYVLNSRGETRSSTPELGESTAPSSRGVTPSPTPVSAGSATETSVEQENDREVGAVSATVGVSEAFTSELLSQEAMRMIADCFERTGEDLDVGVYYAVCGVTGVDVGDAPAFFPRGLASVRAMFADLQYARMTARFMDADARKVAIKLVSNRYNLLNIEIAAFVAAVNSVASKSQRLSQEAGQTVARVVERVNTYEIERAELLALLATMVGDRHSICAVSPPKVVLNKRIAQYCDDLSEAVSCFIQEDLTDTLQACAVEPLISGVDVVRGNQRTLAQRESQTLVSVRTPAWMGYKRVQLSKEILRDESGDILEEWRRVKFKRSSWRKRLTGGGYDVADYD